MLKLMVLTVSILVGTWVVWIFLVHKNDLKEYELPIHPFAHLPFQIIAHRGGMGEAPENTFAAFDHALKVDADIMFELDVQLTKDEQVILMHDTTVDRTTNGSGHVAEMTWDQLKDLDAAAKFGDVSQAENGIKTSDVSFKGKGVKIPLLKDVLERYPHTKMIIEMKDNFIGKAEPIAEVVIQAKAGDRVIFAAESPKMLLEVRRYIQPNPFGGLPMTGLISQEQMQAAAKRNKTPPAWMFAASKDEMGRTAFLDGLGLIGIDKMRADFFSIPEEYDGRRLLTDTLLKEIHRRHKRIFIWTVNENPDMKRLINLGVDGLVTDFPTRLKAVVDEMGLRGKADQKK